MVSNFGSTQKIPQTVIEHNKLTKVTSGYMEVEEFKDSDTHKGYFCYNCEYFIKPNHCMIVTDEGQKIIKNYSITLLMLPSSIDPCVFGLSTGCCCCCCSSVTTPSLSAMGGF